MAIKGVISYWWLPVISGLVWLGMLLGMLLHWIINDNSRHLASMSENQHIAYISDIGATSLKPLFIAGSAVMCAFLDLSFAAERWLRHKGRLVPNSTVLEKVLAILSVLFAVAGTAGLILLTVFDTLRHSRLHDIFLVVFIGGYLLSAIFICWEYQRLGLNREHRVLRISFWVKLTFVLAEIVLAIAFASCNFTKHYNAGAILEWIVAVVFTLYAISFWIDLAPAIRTKSHAKRFVKPGASEMEEGSIQSEGVNATNPNSMYSNGNSRYTSGGPHYNAPRGQQPPSATYNRTNAATDF